MSVRSFLDTNVLVYTDDDASPVKKRRALEIYEECHSDGKAVVSLQVLQEYYVVATRKLGVDPTLARRKAELFSRMDLVTPQVDDVLAAIDLTRLQPISFWDALIVRAAQISQCKVLLSEDLQHGSTFDGLEISNPFLAPAAGG